MGLKFEHIFRCFGCGNMSVGSFDDFSLMAWRYYQENTWPHDKWVCRECQKRPIKIVPRRRGTTCVRFE